jgi:hypothetical protein
MQREGGASHDEVRTDVAICGTDTSFDVNSIVEGEVVMGETEKRDVDLSSVGILDPGLFSIGGQREMC